jgi:hydroxyacylglutathione hydrolase
MIFQRFEEDGLAHFSYVIGDPDSGKTAVIDPRRDTDEYIEWIDDNGLDLVAAVETHLHADYASGAHELAVKADVPHYLSAYDEGEKYQANYDHEALEDGDRLEVGSLMLEAVHTPGHTPEHLSYLLYPDSDADEPEKFFTGDFLFVGSLGRPDLIGEDVKTPLASKLYESVQKIKSMELPDNLAIHPAHGSGSLCGAGLEDDPESTLAQEREANRYFSIEAEDDFVEAVLEALGDFPPYYKRMKETNSRGADPVLPIESPEAIDVGEFESMVERDGVLLDLRDKQSFGSGYIPGSLNIGLTDKLNAWAPWVVPYDTSIYLVGDDSMGPGEMERAYRKLIRVELDDVNGYLDGGFETWRTAGLPVETVEQLSPTTIGDRLESATILDVRMEDEYAEGHIPQARNIPVGRLRERIDELGEDRSDEVITVCGTGYRSSLAASILKDEKFESVGHLKDGFSSWEASNQTVESEQDPLNV